MADGGKVRDAGWRWVACCVLRGEGATQIRERPQMGMGHLKLQI